MIQRIQTVFWLLATIVAGVPLFFPFASFGVNMVDPVEMGLNGVQSGNGEWIVNSWPLLVLGILILIIHLMIIFQYKRRVLQMRMTIYNILLLAGWMIAGYFYASQAAGVLNESPSPEYISIMPVVAIILDVLAWRGVRRDYLMLKAVDRIR